MDSTVLGATVPIILQEEPTANVQSGCPTQPLFAELVEDCLCLYPEKERHLVHLAYSPGELRATLLPHDIDYSNIRVEYYTVAQMVHVISQMTYVLAGCVLFDPSFSQVGPHMYPAYLDLLRSGRLYYTNLNLKLRRTTSNAVPHEVSMEVRRIIRRNGLDLLASRFCLPEGNGSADVVTVMSTGRTMS